MATASQDAFIQQLTNTLIYCEDYQKNLAKKQSDVFNSVLKMSEVELCKHVTDGGLTQELVLARIASEDIDTTKWHQKVLWDAELSMDEMKSLNFNDGQLTLLREVYEYFHETALAHRATMAIYSD